MTRLSRFADSLEGEVFTPGSRGYETIRRPANPAFHNTRPQAVVRCTSVADVAATIDYALDTGTEVTPRGGGHCFAGRSTTDGIVLDLSHLRAISVHADGTATIGAGATLGTVYSVLHDRGRTLPAGCGPTVGIAGLTLGGGIGLLGRTHGLTCDQLVSAQVVLADGRVVDCDEQQEPDLFWALRGAGGGQFGVVTSLRFRTIPQPTTTLVRAAWSDPPVEDLVSAWQELAPDAPDQLTVNLTLTSEPGAPLLATLVAASGLPESRTRGLLTPLLDAGRLAAERLSLEHMLFHTLKAALVDPRDMTGQAVRIRSELFTHPMSAGAITTLVTLLDQTRKSGRRRLAFTALGGAYNTVPEPATAFAHRSQRYLLEHIAAHADPWVDTSWATAHTEGTGRVYPNFPDPALLDPATAYHAGNHARLQSVKAAYDRDRMFTFSQGL